jgi:hypothetical protein
MGTDSGRFGIAEEGGRMANRSAASLSRTEADEKCFGRGHEPKRRGGSGPGTGGHASGRGF